MQGRGRKSVSSTPPRGRGTKIFRTAGPPPGPSGRGGRKTGEAESGAKGVGPLFYRRFRGDAGAGEGESSSRGQTKGLRETAGEGCSPLRIPSRRPIREDARRGAKRGNGGRGPAPPQRFSEAFWQFGVGRKPVFTIFSSIVGVGENSVRPR